MIIFPYGTPSCVTPWEISHSPKGRFVLLRIICISSDIGIFCSSAGWSFLLLSVTEHAGCPREHWVLVWALAKVCGKCSRGFKWRKQVNYHGIALRPARDNQAHVNPENKASFLPHVIFPLLDVHHTCFLFFRLWLLLLAYNSSALSLSLYDSHERCFCVLARENSCVCARSVQRDTVVRKSRCPYVAHHDGRFLNMYGCAHRENCK